MFQLIGGIIDKLVFIVAGIFLFTQYKKLNKPRLKWIAIILIICGVFLGVMDIMDSIE